MKVGGGVPGASAISRSRTRARSLPSPCPRLPPLPSPQERPLGSFCRSRLCSGAASGSGGAGCHGRRRPRAGSRHLMASVASWRHLAVLAGPSLASLALPPGLPPCLGPPPPCPACLPACRPPRGCASTLRHEVMRLSRNPRPRPRRQRPPASLTKQCTPPAKPRPRAARPRPSRRGLLPLPRTPPCPRYPRLPPARSSRRHARTHAPTHPR